MRVFVVSPTTTSMSARRERKHRLIDTNASNRSLQTGKFSGLPQNFGTACLILLNSRGPAFTPELSTNSSSLTSLMRTTPGAGNFPPVRTPSGSLLGLDWPLLGHGRWPSAPPVSLALTPEIAASQSSLVVGRHAIRRPRLPALC